MKNESPETLFCHNGYHPLLRGYLSLVYLSWEDWWTHYDPPNVVDRMKSVINDRLETECDKLECEIDFIRL